MATSRCRTTVIGPGYLHDELSIFRKPLYRGCAGECSCVAPVFFGALSHGCPKAPRTCESKSGKQNAAGLATQANDAAGLLIVQSISCWVGLSRFRQTAACGLRFVNAHRRIGAPLSSCSSSDDLRETGVASNQRILIAATDALLRGLKVVSPPDGTATQAERRHAMLFGAVRGCFRSGRHAKFAHSLTDESGNERRG